MLVYIHGLFLLFQDADDFNLLTRQLNVSSDSFRDTLTLEAILDEFGHDNDTFESFRLNLIHLPDILPQNIVLGATVITIEDVGE